MTTRRGFMASILALGAAPAIVRADSLMRIVPRELGIVRVNPWAAANVNWLEASALAKLEWLREMDRAAAAIIRANVR